MERRAPAMSVAVMSGASSRAAARVRDVARLAADIEADARKSERLTRHECKACFYFSRIGGAAVTKQACMRCHKEQWYGSTNTDVLCMDCAKDGSLCKHCGGDIDMREHRRTWPKAYSESDPETQMAQDIAAPGHLSHQAACADDPASPGSA